MTKSLITCPTISELPDVPSINKEGEAKKLELIAMGSAITVVETEGARDLAIDVAGKIKGHMAAVEKAADDLSKPFYRMWKSIIAVKEGHFAGLNSEMRRLNNLAGAFEQKRREAAAEEERKRKEADAKAERDRLDAINEQNRIAEEAKRKADELAAKGKKLSSKEQAAITKAELDAQEAEEAAERERNRIAEERNQRAIQEQSEKPTGGAQREEIDVVITSIEELYAAFPNLVRLEPKMGDIKAAIRLGMKLPGVTFTKRFVFNAKAR